MFGTRIIIHDVMLATFMKVEDVDNWYSYICIHSWPKVWLQSKDFIKLPIYIYNNNSLMQETFWGGWICYIKQHFVTRIFSFKMLSKKRRYFTSNTNLIGAKLLAMSVLRFHDNDDTYTVIAIMLSLCNYLLTFVCHKLMRKVRLPVIRTGIVWPVTTFK